MEEGGGPFRNRNLCMDTTLLFQIKKSAGEQTNWLKRAFKPVQNNPKAVRTHCSLVVNRIIFIIFNFVFDFL
jgi:hypothetical protein